MFVIAQENAEMYKQSNENLRTLYYYVNLIVHAVSHSKIRLI
jgi:hypothetical protein